CSAWDSSQSTRLF
nr:immunoglobulin light chain junction region [Macaca mulatta]